MKTANTGPDFAWVDAHMKQWLAETTREERQKQIEEERAQLSPEMLELMNLPDEPPESDE